MAGGFLLLATETLAPGVFLLFFGLGAVFMGFVELIFPDLPLWVDILLFLGISTLWLALFRRRLIAYIERRNPAKKVDSIAGEVAIALDDLAPSVMGRAELRGAGWSAMNLSDQLIPKSARCRVEKVEGLTLLVRPL